MGLSKQIDKLSYGMKLLFSPNIEYVVGALIKFMIFEGNITDIYQLEFCIVYDKILRILNEMTFEQDDLTINTRTKPVLILNA